MGAQGPALGSQCAVAQPRFRKAYGREERPAPPLLLLPFGATHARTLDAFRRDLPSVRQREMGRSERWHPGTHVAKLEQPQKNTESPGMFPFPPCFSRTHACECLHRHTHRSTWMLCGAGAVASEEDGSGREHGGQQAGELLGSAAVKWD